MSRAFVKDQDGADIGDDVPERVVSPHRNLVTLAGLAQIDAALRAAREALSAARGAQDRSAAAHHARDLRYWTQRRGNAELVPPPADSSVVRFGSRVTLATGPGATVAYRIVGEDEAAPAEGRISYVSPLAQALLGSAVGDVVAHGDGEAEILGVEV